MGILKTIVRKIQKTQERRVAYWQLQRMSDRELRDIGISRSQLYDVVYNSDE